MERQYFSKVGIEGIGSRRIFYPMWNDVFPNDRVGIPRQASQSIESGRYLIWSGILDTNDEQHAKLVASTDVAYISDNMMPKSLSELTADEMREVAELCGFAKINIEIFRPRLTKVAHVLQMFQGRVCNDPVSKASEALNERRLTKEQIAAIYVNYK